MTGPDLAALRHAHGWTQRQLAGLLGVTEITVRRYELGLRRIDEPTDRLIRVLTHPTGKRWIKAFSRPGGAAVESG